MCEHKFDIRIVNDSPRWVCVRCDTVAPACFTPIASARA